LCFKLFEDSRDLGNISRVFQGSTSMMLCLFVFQYWSCRSKLVFNNCFIKERSRMIAVLSESNREDLVDKVDESLKGFKSPWKLAFIVHPVIWMHIFAKR